MSFSKYPEYKDSGVEWLGKVPAHWAVNPLKFGASCNDTVLPESTDDDYEIEYVEISGVDEVLGITESSSHKFSAAPSRARRIVQDGDVLVSTVRTYLRAIAPVVNPSENLIVSTGFAVIRPGTDVLDGSFLGYLVRAEWWISEVISQSVGVSYPSINASDLMALPVAIPALSEQTQIARFLDHETARIDALIEEQQRLIELLKEKRQAVISHAVTKGLDPDVPMKDSGVEWLGEVPAHWVNGSLKNMAIIRNGKDYKDVESPDGEYPVLGSGGQFSSANQYLYEGESVLLGRKGTIDKPLYINGRFWTVDTMFYTEIDGATCAKFFYYSALVIPFHYYSTSTALPSMTQEDLLNHPVAIPSLVEQTQIARFLDRETARIDTLVNEAESAIELLKERRSALISAAVTGKIDVRGWQPPAGSSTSAEATQTETV